MVRRRFVRSVFVWSLISSSFSSLASSSSELSAVSYSSSSLPSASPRISAFSFLYASSCSSHSASNLKTFNLSWTSKSSSKLARCVIWSSSSTRSSSSLIAGLSLYLSFLTWKRTSIIYCTLLSMSCSCKMFRNWSKTARAMGPLISSKCCPTSLVKPTAISTPSSVGLLSKSNSICAARTSCTTC